MERLLPYLYLMRLHKPIGALLLLWPTLWALWIAGQGSPDPLILFVFVAGVLLMRSAGCVINDYADRDIDRHVQRTRERPLTTGQVSERAALGLFAVLCLIAFGLVLLLDWAVVLMSLVAVFLAATYPFMKRYTYLPQVYLGAAFGWSIPMAFMAETGGVPAAGWMLFVVNILWTTAYDTMYAMVDRPDDLRIGVKSTAILFGETDRVAVGILQMMALAGLIMLGRQLGLGWVYYFGLAAAAGFAVYEQYLIKDREPALCFRAFLNNNWFGAVIFAGILGHYQLQSLV